MSNEELIEELRSYLPLGDGRYWSPSSKAYAKAAEALAQADNEIESLRKDAKRFEWLLAHPDATICSDGSYGPVHIWLRYSNRLVGYGSKTAREAIDAAMKGKP